MVERLVPVLSLVFVVLLALPLLGLVGSVDGAMLRQVASEPALWAALGVSLRTSLVALLFMAVLGTPLAWWLSRGRSPWLLLLLEIPVVLPPAVLGVALLQTFGRAGWLGLPLSFTPLAVVLAQWMVGAPLFVLTATAAFRVVTDDIVLVARSLGARPGRVFFRVVLPIAAPGWIAALALGWARAVGEFGATLMFAGNLPGRTQTLPLSIYSALEQDVGLATATSMLLLVLALSGLLMGRLLAWRLHARP